VLRSIVPDPIPPPSPVELEKLPQDDDDLAIDVDLEEIEATVRLPLDEAQRLVDAAFPKPE